MIYQGPKYLKHQIKYDEGISKTTNLDRWMDGKWIVQNPDGTIIAWFSEEEDATQFITKLNETLTAHET